MAAGSGGEQSTTFSVKLDDQVSAPAEKAAVSVDDLRKAVTGGESSIKEMQAQLRRLRGNTKEVTAAKDELKAKLNATRSSVSAAQLALVKQNASLKETKAASTEASGGMSLLASGAGLAAGAILALVAASGAVAVSFAKWVLRSADTARSLALVREAAAGSAANGKALGTQIDALADKVPTSKAALNDLANSLAKGGIQGQALVDTFNAVGQAASAMGDEAGSKIKALVDRGRMSGRLAIGPDMFSEDLRGTGIGRDDVAKALADQMHVGVDKARAALAEGRVKLGDGAKALRTAVEQKFGDLNLRKMMTLDGLAETLRKRLSTLTAGVDLEPALKAVSKLLDLFGDSTVAGSALQRLVELSGNGLVKAVTVSAPYMRKFFQGVVIGALQVAIVVLKVRNHLISTFGGRDVLGKLDLFNAAMKVGEVTITAIAIALGLAASAAALLGGFFAAAAVSTYNFGKSVVDILAVMTDLEAKMVNAGKSVVEGLVRGLRQGFSKATTVVHELADKIKGDFKEALGIHSPSSVFAGYGENTVAGYEQGVTSSTPKAARALDKVGEQPASMGRGGAAGGAPAPLTVNMPVSLTSNGGPSPESMAKAMSDPSILAQLAKAFEQVLISNGIPVAVEQ